MKIFLLAALTCLASPDVSLANGLTISNVQRDSLAGIVSFEIEWFNSWRVESLVDSLSAPFNWDAAWVFVKFQACDAGPSDPWLHASLNDTLNLHQFDQLEPVLSDGSGIGLDPDLKGVMLRRTTNGLFRSQGASTVTLKLTNLDPNTAYNIRVIGTEMVFVNGGTFEIGGITASNAFSANTDPTDPAVGQISSSASATINSHASGANASVILPAAFPKGFGAFHLMKYEITQEQYAFFLNAISRNVQARRYPGNFNTNRQRLTASGLNPLSVYSSDRPDRAQNYLGWDDIAAFLDWACLRPMSELEYEKSCRGTAGALQDECAWGTPVAFELTDITAPEDGTEIPGNLPANANYVNNNLVGGDAGRGPVRAGIFALPGNATRTAAGGSYFGSMEMSGNVWEACVGVLSVTALSGTVNFSTNTGDGLLDANGDADVSGWPSLATGGFVLRGGSWIDGLTLLRVSNRYLSWNGARSSTTGGRVCASPVRKSMLHINRNHKYLFFHEKPTLFLRMCDLGTWGTVGRTRPSCQ